MLTSPAGPARPLGEPLSLFTAAAGAAADAGVRAGRPRVGVAAESVRGGPAADAGWVADAVGPAELWREFAPALAGRPRVRVSRDGGRTYGGRGSRLTTRLPDWPAAVCLYDHDGSARVLAVDLDVSRGGVGQVLADTDRLCRLLERVGARFLVDESPTGGRHVWVPLGRPRPAAALQRVLRALAGLLPSLDLVPMSNPATGCLRPPGSAHPAGGHQRLVTPWAQAVDAVRVRTGDTAWAALLEELTPQLVDLPPATAGAGAGSGGGRGGARVDVHATARPGGARRLPADYDGIARTGRYDPARYRSASEARMAVLASAAAHGWSLADVQVALDAGRWPGLAGFYARYRAHHRAQALGRDWGKALRYAGQLHAAQPAGQGGHGGQGGRPARPLTHAGAHAGTQAGVRPVAISDTGGNPSQPRPGLAHAAQQPPAGRELSPYVHVRVWTTAVEFAVPDRWSDRSGQSKRAVLRAVAEAAHRRGSRYIDVGCRSLGLGSVLDHSTVAEVLRALRDEPDPVLVLLEDQRGGRGDLYELRIPDSHRDQAESAPWRPGRLTGLHPVYHQLGVPAALLYDAVRAGEPTDVDTLAATSHLSRATVYRAATRLAAHGLLTRTAGGWRRTRLRLDTLARRLGIPALVDGLLQRIRAERRDWHALLGLVRSLAGPDPQHVLAELAGVPPPPEPPPDPPRTPLELLYDVLGAVLVDPHTLADA